MPAADYTVYNPLTGNIMVDLDCETGQVTMVGLAISNNAQNSLSAGMGELNGLTEVDIEAPAVTDNTLIFLQLQVAKTAGQTIHMTDRTSGVGFSVAGSIDQDTSQFAWILVEPVTIDE